MKKVVIIAVVVLLAIGFVSLLDNEMASEARNFLQALLRAMF
jgi:hypothetical protein